MPLRSLLFPAMLLFAPLPQASAGDYLITVREADGDYTLTVDARVPATDRLRMAMYGGIDHLPDQWTSFVRGLSIVDDAGAPVESRHEGAEGWSLNLSRESTLTLRYLVDLSFTRGQWPPGNEQAGAIIERAIYLVTRPLFIYAEDDRNHTVRFDLPARWVATTPWATIDPVTFAVPDNESLAENTVVLGQHIAHVFRQGPIALTVVPLGSLGAGAARVPQVLGATVQQAMEVFTDARPQRIMMTFFPAHQDDGESFNDSAAFTVGKPMSDAGLPLWGNNLAHELFHHWIGGDIALSEDDSGEWFEEGFTDYYADRSLVRTGHIDARGFLTKAEKVIGRYLYYYSGASFDPLPMIEASQRKGRNRFAVHDGGWALALCLDIKLRASGAAGLDDLMRALHARSAASDRPLDLADFVATVAATSNREISEFARAAVTTAGAFPIRQCLAAAGLELEIQAYAAEAWIAQAAPSVVFDSIIAPPASQDGAFGPSRHRD